MQKQARLPHVAPRSARAEPLAERLICWDLDETLGQFYGIYARMNGHSYRGIEGLRPGIRQALSELSGLGFTHVLTTAAGEREATAAITHSGLIEFFDAVFHDTMLLRDIRKDYSVVADSFELQGNEFRRRAIVVGDILPLDMPDNGVFIWEPDSPRYSAHIAKSIILLMSEKGNNDFWSGFGTLYGEGALQPPPNPEGIRRFRLSDGFEAALFYRGGSAIAHICMEGEGPGAGLEQFQP